MLDLQRRFSSHIFVKFLAQDSGVTRGEISSGGTWGCINFFRGAPTALLISAADSGFSNGGIQGAPASAEGGCMPPVVMPLALDQLVETNLQQE